MFELEDKRKGRMQDLATLIQKVYRGWSQWRKVGEKERDCKTGLKIKRSPLVVLIVLMYIKEVSFFRERGEE